LRFPQRSLLTEKVASQNAVIILTLSCRQHGAQNEWEQERKKTTI